VNTSDVHAKGEI
jgi:HAMP domain-containing protein